MTEDEDTAARPKAHWAYAPREHPGGFGPASPLTLLFLLYLLMSGAAIVVLALYVSVLAALGLAVVLFGAGVIKVVDEWT